MACKLRFLEWLGTLFFQLSQKCTHATIGQTVLSAYRERSPNATHVILARYDLLKSIGEFTALDMLGAMHRQIERENKSPPKRT